MSRVIAPKGDYLRMAELADIEFLFACTRDWPNGAWPYSQCEAHVKASFEQVMLPDGSADVRSAVLIYCLDDDSSIGFLVFSFYSGEASGIDFNALAVHPDMRGSSIYDPAETRYHDFEQIIGYYANQVLEAKGARYEIIETATTITRKSKDRSAVMGSNQKARGRVRGKQSVAHDYSVYRSAAFDSRDQLDGFSVSHSHQ